MIECQLLTANIRGDFTFCIWITFLSPADFFLLNLLRFLGICHLFQKNQSEEDAFFDSE